MVGGHGSNSIPRRNAPPPPPEYILNITLPTLRGMRGLSWYWRLADPPLYYPRTPFAHRPFAPPPPPSYATSNPSLLPDRPASPMAVNKGVFRHRGRFGPRCLHDGLGTGGDYFLRRGGGGIKFHNSWMWFLTKKMWHSQGLTTLYPKSSNPSPRRQMPWLVPCLKACGHGEA